MTHPTWHETNVAVVKHIRASHHQSWTLIAAPPADGERKAEDGRRATPSDRGEHDAKSEEALELLEAAETNRTHFRDLLSQQFMQPRPQSFE